MIFVIVGTDTHPFNRLLEWVDEAIEKKIIKDRVIAQIGNSTYKPKNYEYSHFFSYEDMKKLLKKSKLIIAHAGAGTVIDALSLNKKLIVVPRRKKFNEHTDDHQVELAKLLAKEKKCVVAFSKKEFFESIERIRNDKIDIKVKKPKGIINEIKKVIRC